MKKIILFFAMHCVVFYAKAQVYDLALKKLIDQYVSVYNKTDPKENFFVRMTAAANNVFLVDNNLVYDAVKKTKMKYRVTIDSSVNLVFDSVILGFSKDHIWGENLITRDKFSTFFELYNNKMCPCVTEKIQKSPRNFLEVEDMNNCVAALIKDTFYLNETKRLLGHLTLNEINNISQLSGIYIYQHCKAMYRYFSESVRYESVYPFLDRIKTKLSQMDHEIVKLYRSKSPELARMFSNYKKFETDLRLASAVLANKDVVHFSDRIENSDGSCTLINTYYNNKQGRPLLHGQITYTVGDPVFAKSVLSFRFVPVAKMKDTDKYLKMIEENDVLPPPPPMLEMKSIEIDTLHSKN